MDLFDKIIKIPNNLGKDISVEIYSAISNICDKLYGLSIFYRGAKKWKFYTGTLPFLYGIWLSVNHSNKIYDEMNNRLIKFKMDLDDNFHGTVFFNLDINNIPINIIKSFKIIRDICLNFLFESNDDKYITITSYLYDQYDEIEDEEYDRFPKLIFKI